MPVLECGGGTGLGRSGQWTARRRQRRRHAGRDKRIEGRQLGLVVSVVELYGEMIRNQGFDLRFESTAIPLPDVDRRGKHQGRHLHAFLNVVPLDVKDRRRIAYAVLYRALDANLVIIGS